MNMLVFLALMAAGTFFLGAQDVAQKKYLRDGIDDQLLLGVAWTLAGLLLLPILWVTGIPELKPGFWLAISAGVLLNSFSQNIFIRAFKLADASLVAPLRFITPVLVILTGFFILGEVPTLGGVLGILLTLLGLMLLVWQEDFSFSRHNYVYGILQNRGLFLGVLGSILFAFSLPFDKKAVVTSSALFMVILSLSSVGIITLVWNSFLKRDFRGELTRAVSVWKRPLFLVAILGAAGTFLVNQALSYTLVAYAASVKRLWSFWTVILAGRFLEEKVGWRLTATFIMLLGIFITAYFG